MNKLLFINQAIEEILNEESYVSDTYYEELYDQEMEIQNWYKQQFAQTHEQSLMRESLTRLFFLYPATKTLTLNVEF